MAGGLLVADAVGLIVDAVDGRMDVAARIAGLAAVTLLLAATFLWRRTRADRVLMIVIVGWFVALAIHDPPLVTQRSGVQIVLAVYAVASWSERRRLAVVVPAALAALAALGTAGNGEGIVAVLSIPLAIVAAPWFAGYAARMRRHHLADVEERLRRAEDEVDERARLAVLEERARIARDVHDVVAHHVSLIGVQAGAARTALGRADESTTRDALADIESSSRDAVSEMRHLLDAIGAGDGASDVRDPAPDLTQFDRLCESYRRAGLTVDCSMSGALELLQPVETLALYRIAEEALTNVTRHSSSSACTLTVDADRVAARLRVIDPGPINVRLAAVGTGRGLIGMRQRVALFGGTLVTGPTDHGWLVDATIPLARP